MKLSRKWINEEFINLSHISDREFVETMNAIGHKVHSLTQTEDTVLDLEIAEHRSDCHSIIGLAREAAAAFGKPMKHHKPVVTGSDTGSIYELLDVDVFADELCNRYTARMIRNVKIAASPQWMQQRLKTCSIPPCNNIVDIANYVMLEYGQPLHAFDYRCISAGSMAIRKAEDDEILTDPDGRQLRLHSGMPVIADDDRILGIAGILSAENSEIQDDTVTVVLEAASFGSETIRQTSLALGVKTNSSIRFEKNLDPMMTVPAVERACELIEMLECGEVLDGIIDILNYIPAPRTLELEHKTVNRLLGTDISNDDMVAYLRRLEIPVEGRSILIPSFRPDLVEIADIANEIDRLYRNDQRCCATPHPLIPKN